MSVKNMPIKLQCPLINTNRLHVWFESKISVIEQKQRWKTAPSSIIFFTGFDNMNKTSV